MPRVGAWLASDWLCVAESKTAAPASRASPLLQGVCEVECLLWEPGLPAIGCTGAESKTASPASRASPLLQGVCEAECLVWEPGLPAIGCAGAESKTASPASRASPLLRGGCEAECLVWEPGLPAIGCAWLRVKLQRLHRGQARSYRGFVRPNASCGSLACQRLAVRG